MSWHGERVHPLVMDTLSLLIIAIGSLAFLDIAAANLRGTERTTRTGRSARARR
jgi:hypothetical protein